MNKHCHHDCKHESVKYCSKCGKVYCEKCGREWEDKCTLTHYYNWPITYTYPQTTQPSVYPIGAAYTAAAGNSITDTLTCNHQG
jgi:hypothetical protein